MHKEEDSDHLEAVLAECAPRGFQPPVADFSSMPRGERAAYGVLSSYLNTCCVNAREAYYSDNNDNRIQNCALDTVFTKNFRWFAYDKEAKSRTSVLLKVDLGGCILQGGDCDALASTLAQSREEGKNAVAIHWEHMIIFAEVKGRSKDEQLAQAMTYSRQIFAHQPDRVSQRCILFNHRTRGAVIAEVDRAGVYCSRSHDLGQQQDLDRFSWLLAGMYCSPTDAHGYNRRIRWESNQHQLTSIQIWVDNVWLHVSDQLCDRTGLWGRCTRAFRVQRDEVMLARDAPDETPVDEAMPDPSGEESRSEQTGTKRGSHEEDKSAPSVRPSSSKLRMFVRVLNIAT